MIRQAYINTTSNVLTWTANAGALPTPYLEKVAIYANGLKLTGIDYVVTPNISPGQSTITIDINIHLDGNNYEVYATT
jgi:hypothetical protein